MADEADIAAVHTWTGSQPSDDAIEDLLDAGQSVHQVALGILQQRRADLIAAGPSISISGHGSRGSSAELVKALDYDIETLQALVLGPAAAVQTLQFSRSDRERGCR